MRALLVLLCLVALLGLSVRCIIWTYDRFRPRRISQNVRLIIDMMTITQGWTRTYNRFLHETGVVLWTGSGVAGLFLRLDGDDMSMFGDVTLTQDERVALWKAYQNFGQIEKDEAIKAFANRVNDHFAGLIK